MILRRILAILVLCTGCRQTPATPCADAADHDPTARNLQMAALGSGRDVDQTALAKAQADAVAQCRRRAGLPPLGTGVQPYAKTGTVWP